MRLPRYLNSPSPTSTTNCSSFIHTKVVIWLPVNQLQVKLPVTGFNYQLPVTDLPIFFLHAMQFSASASSHTLVQANKDRPTLDPDIPAPSTARYCWFRFTQYLTVESAPLPSPRQVAAAGKGGREEVRT